MENDINITVQGNNENLADIEKDNDNLKFKPIEYVMRTMNEYED